ncbi:hypothetical protein [Microseira wollei]|uniref:hypothetical protein n=1 Tax=Microseira wollei TaxID=467598 RepID=UPI001CFE7E4E|nr:hypothetical protein [Microseira wollei]
MHLKQVGPDAHATRKIYLLWGGRRAGRPWHKRRPCHKKNISFVGWATGGTPMPQEKYISCGVGVPPAQCIGARSETAFAIAHTLALF